MIRTSAKLLRLYLEKEGYGVILAHDGEEAVVKFNALKPDIILLDIIFAWYRRLAGMP